VVRQRFRFQAAPRVDGVWPWIQKRSSKTRRPCGWSTGPERKCLNFWCAQAFMWSYAAVRARRIIQSTNSTMARSWPATQAVHPNARTWCIPIGRSANFRKSSQPPWLSARSIWTQSGASAAGIDDPRGCWAAEEELRSAEALVREAGLNYISRPYIGDVVREIGLVD
jgi:hypothetical protein